MEAKITKQEIETLSRTPGKRKWYSKIGLALFVMTIPTILYIFIFHYLPLSGLVIAFKIILLLKEYLALLGLQWEALNIFIHL